MSTKFDFLFHVADDKLRQFVDHYCSKFDPHSVSKHDFQQKMLAQPRDTLLAFFLTSVALSSAEAREVTDRWFSGEHICGRARLSPEEVAELRSRICVAAETFLVALNRSAGEFLAACRELLK